MGIPLGIYLDSYVVAKGALFPLGLLWMAATPTVLGWR
jgi:hypothetical protein